MIYDLDECSVTVRGAMRGDRLAPEYDDIEDVFVEFCKAFGVAEDYVDMTDTDITFAFKPGLHPVDLERATAWLDAVRLP